MQTLSQATSKFTFTGKLGNEKLTNGEKAKIRMNKLVAAEKDGRLAKAVSRKDICRIVGIDDMSAQSQSAWFCRQLRRKTITETLQKFDPDTKQPIYEYHIFPKRLGKRIKKETKPIQHYEWKAETKMPEKPIVETEPKEELPKVAQKPETPEPIDINIPLDNNRNISLSITLNINFTK